MAALEPDAALSVLGTPDDFTGLGAPPVQELVVMVVANLVSLVAMYWRHRTGLLRFIPEQMVSIGIGAAVGGVSALLDYDELSSDVTSGFSGVFFSFFLPAIIFSNAYSVKHQSFFRNLSGILCFSVLGTIMSTLFIAFGVHLAYSHGWVRDGTAPGTGHNDTALLTHVSADSADPADPADPADFGGPGGVGAPPTSLPLVDCLILGSLLSAVDPGAVLTMLPASVDRQLYALLFGESVLNSAIAIVLYNSFRMYHNVLVRRGAGMDAILAEDVRMLAVRFVVISALSMAIGVAVGLTSAFLLKRMQLRASPGREQAVLFLFAYLSYLLPRDLGLSPVVSLFLCGATMAHYSFYSLSRMSQIATSTWFKTIGLVAETFVSVFMGVAVSQVQENEWRPDLIVAIVLLCVLSRVFHILVLSNLINAAKWASWHCSALLSRQRGGEEGEEEGGRGRGRGQGPSFISLPAQLFISWSGLRGAVAFALALHAPVLNQEGAMLTTTLSVVLFTYVVQGSTTFCIARRLGLVTEDDLKQEEASERDHLRYLSLHLDPASATPEAGSAAGTGSVGSGAGRDAGLGEHGLGNGNGLGLGSADQLRIRSPSAIMHFGASPHTALLNLSQPWPSTASTSLPALPTGSRRRWRAASDDDEERAERAAAKGVLGGLGGDHSAGDRSAGDHSAGGGAGAGAGAGSGSGGYGTFATAWRAFDDRVMKPVFGGSARKSSTALPVTVHEQRRAEDRGQQQQGQQQQGQQQQGQQQQGQQQQGQQQQGQQQQGQQQRRQQDRRQQERRQVPHEREQDGGDHDQGAEDAGYRPPRVETGAVAGAEAEAPPPGPPASSSSSSSSS